MKVSLSVRLSHSNAGWMLFGLTVDTSLRLFSCVLLSNLGLCIRCGARIARVDRISSAQSTPNFVNACAFLFVLL